MSAHAEILALAAALYLWESMMWMPLGAVAMRRALRGGKWRVSLPGAWFAGREAGLLPLWPLPPDSVAICRPPPLFVDEGRLYLEIRPGRFEDAGAAAWADLRTESQHLCHGDMRVKLSSLRTIEFLSKARRRGLDPGKAVDAWWRRALSPVYGSREWQRWNQVSRGLRIGCPLLTLGFWAGLPLIYFQFGLLPALGLAGGLWLTMGWIAAQLFWLGKRVYRTSRAALWMDAFLACCVPFHAMRAFELAAVHAMAPVHPAAMMCATGDLSNGWLARYVRGLRHPRPECPGDEEFSRAISPLMRQALHRAGGLWESYDFAPGKEGAPEATAYCPRCQALYLPERSVCHDCGGVSLKRF